MSLSFSSLSIRKQIAVLALVAMVPAILFLAWLGVHEWRSASTDAYDKARILAFDTASALDMLLRDSEAIMSRLAERPLIKSLDAKNCDPFLSEFVQANRNYASLFTVDLEGNRLCSALRNPQSRDFRGFSWFQDAVRRRQFVAGNASVGRATGRWISELTYPIRDTQGRISGVLALPLDLINLNQRLLGTVPANAIVVVNDRRGDILLRSRDVEAWVGKPSPAGFVGLAQRNPDGFIRGTGVDGVRRLYAWVTLPNTGWQVVAGLPDKDLLADFKNRAAWSAAISVIALLLALWLVYRISRTIGRPVGELARTSAAVAAGNSAVRASISGPSEIREVAQQFNLMLDAREKSELALRDSQRLLRQTFLALDQAVFVVDPNTRSIVACNAAVERIFGYTEEQVLGRHIEFLHVNRERFEEFGKQLDSTLEREGVFQTEFRMRHKNGKVFPTENTVTPILDGAGRRVARVSMVRDITERKRTEMLLRTRLRLSELGQTGSTHELLQAAIDAAEEVTGSQIGFFHFVDPDQEHVSPQTWSTNTLKGMCHAEGKHRHYPISEAGVWVDCFHAKAPVIHNDYAGLPHKKGMPAGHAKVIRELVVPILRAGKVTEIMGVANKATDYDQKDAEAAQLIASMTQDVLDRRRAEESLCMSEMRLRGIFDQAPIGIAISDSHTERFLQVNPRFCAIVGRSENELLGTTFQDITHPDDRQEGRDIVALMLQGRIDKYTMQKRCVRPDDVVVWANVTVAPMWSNAQEPRVHLAIIEDVTERMGLEELHLQTQNLESLGTLAGGIAHDFNNILAAIKGNADLAAEDVGPDHLAAESLQEIRKASDRASELVRRIMTFGRPKGARRETVDLRVVVAEVLKLLRSTLPAV